MPLSVQVVCGLVMWLWRDDIGGVFTGDVEVNAVVAMLAPIAALFQVRRRASTSAMCVRAVPLRPSRVVQ